MLSRSWWWKIAFVLGLVLVSFGGLIPTVVELGLYPEQASEDLEVDLPKIAAIFEVIARPRKGDIDATSNEIRRWAEDDLVRLAETINTEVGFYRGEGRVKVDLKPDGSIVGWVDDNRDTKFTSPFEVLESDEARLEALNQAASIDLAKAKPDSVEMVFRVWFATSKEGKPTLVMMDRDHRVFSHELKRLPREPQKQRTTPLLVLMQERREKANGGQPWTPPQGWAKNLLDSSVDSEQAGIDARLAELPGWYHWFSDSFTNKTLTLGLDLKGGLLLRYSVGIEEAINLKLKSFSKDLDAKLGAATFDAKVISARQQLEVTFKNSEAQDKLDGILSDYQSLTIVNEEGSTFTLAFKEERLNEMRQAILSQAVETIRKRVDQFGLANPAVRVEGGRHIMVELPGLSKQRAREAERVISTTAVLTFKRAVRKQREQAIVNELRRRDKPDGVVYEKNFETQNPELRANNVYAPNGSIVRQGKSILRSFVLSNSDLIDKGLEVAYEEITPRVSKEEEGTAAARPYWVIRVVEERLIISGEHVDNAFPASDPDTNMPYVALKLNSQGGKAFGDFTTFTKGVMEHGVDRLAILMDDTLISDPTVQDKIGGGSVSITMGARNRGQALADVEALVISLQSGSLSAPIEQEFKTLVGPTLGRDSIEGGAYALTIGMVLVIIFMFIYYKASGIIANIALTLNLLFILAIMALMGSTLTLPGIAGIVLTVGMAVDANVIIFERVREELRAGELPGKAIQQGYDKAYWTILDANITTGLAAIVLMEFGSGPVQGFAVTLLIGIISSVFTAIFVTRLLFDWWLAKHEVSRLSI